MIIGVFGLPGAGKTTFLAKCAYKCLRGESFLGIPPHSKVFTNFECPGAYKLDFSTLGLYHYEDCLILIDEIMLLADTRDFKSFPEHLKFFFCMSRHFRVDICYCSQYWSDCDKKIRVLTSCYYLLESSNVFPVSYVKPINRSMGAEHNQMVDNYSVGAPISWKIVYRPKYYKLFDSFYNDRELKKVDFPLWAPALFDSRPFKERFFDFSGSPVLRLCRLLCSWDRSPILNKLHALRNSPSVAEESATVSEEAEIILPEEFAKGIAFKFLASRMVDESAEDVSEKK